MDSNGRRIGVSSAESNLNPSVRTGHHHIPPPLPNTLISSTFLKKASSVGISVCGGGEERKVRVLTWVAP